MLGMVPRRLLRSAVKRARWSRSSGLRDQPSGLGRSGVLRGRCPWLSARIGGWSPRARTYSGQRRCGRHCPAAFAQVRGDMEVQAGAVCKTVGSAYVGSNPTPATTCENAR